MKSSEIRSSFLKYFERNGHRIVPSSPLVPHDDPTLLFTNAGMNQFKDLFLGKEQREYRRATTSQKVMRVSGKHNDLDNVGPSYRHHTFFQMLGNFSFGDYFKKDAIGFAWELLTETWKLPADRLYITIFSGEAGIPRDDEAFGFWRTFVPTERIVEFGVSENFWAMADTGPCGRCSELHYFRGNHIDCGEERAGRQCQGLACSCDRFVEIWNNVFMEFDRQPDGTLAPLPAPSIDTGMGLERITAVLQNTVSNYDTDQFTPLLAAIGDAAGTHHTGTMTSSDVSMRVVADHTRAMTFLIADGVLPSNEWRGYVLRKIMRRAMRHGKRLGITEPFLHRLVGVIDREMGDAYPEVRAGRAAIEQVIHSEEERFDIVLSAGLPKLEEALEEAASGNTHIPGDLAFRLYDTFGLPLDFIEDLASERHVGVDRAGFERSMEVQREKARAKSTFKTAEKETWYIPDRHREELRAHGDQFKGYETTSVAGAQILFMTKDGPHGPVPAKALQTGERGYIALTATPFYLESGGQVSDVGKIYSPSAQALVEGVVRIPGMFNIPRLHRVYVQEGRLSERDIVTAEVDAATRDATRRNHTATHLLHAALRQVLGTHVKQAGSLVAQDRLRFDFVHFAPLTREQLAQTERIVNEQIYRNAAVHTEERSTEEAIAAGATALFGEKYGDRVRVVSIPGFSMELCGGTHCRATGDIGLLTIVNEGGVAAGVRRIEAVTGEHAITRYQTDRETLREVIEALNSPTDRAVDTVQRLQSDIKRLAKEANALRISAFTDSAKDAGETVDVSGVKLATREIANVEKGALRSLADSMRDKMGSGVVVLAATEDGKVAIVVSVTKDLVSRVHAGQMIKQLAPVVGGSGGGRADFAEAGGKDPSKIGELFSRAQEILGQMLQSTL